MSAPTYLTDAERARVMQAMTDWLAYLNNAEAQAASMIRYLQTQDSALYNRMIALGWLKARSNGDAARTAALNQLISDLGTAT
jgi:hypothetical protein